MYTATANCVFVCVQSLCTSVCSCLKADKSGKTAAVQYADDIR